LELSLRGNNKKAIAVLSDVLASMRTLGLEGEAAIRCHLAHAQLRAGSFDASRKTAEEAADLARRRGSKVWLAYAEWLLGGQILQLSGNSSNKRARNISRDCVTHG